MYQISSRLSLIISCQLNDPLQHFVNGFLDVSSREKSKSRVKKEYDTIVIPLCQGNHWFYCNVHPKQCRVDFYDSLFNPCIASVTDMKTLLNVKIKEQKWDIVQKKCVTQAEFNLSF